MSKSCSLALASLDAISKQPVEPSTQPVVGIVERGSDLIDASAENGHTPAGRLESLLEAGRLDWMRQTLICTQAVLEQALERMMTVSRIRGSQPPSLFSLPFHSLHPFTAFLQGR
ncbi:unnamed protein product [Protopolystoma xenopodis]|uniref:Uncharacterized protein n=1 Tax=Protopolystoma xenopodis TaxID=117903 RepID=A0A3S5C788_9PLAT|nr:unnamed protein product [Protopolystoma xenopodis]